MNAALLVIALATVASAALALSQFRILHSVLILTASWLGVASFYLWAGAGFVAFAQVLIYLGAISMAVLFAVLLTRRSDDSPAPPAAGSRVRVATGVAAAAAVAAVLLTAAARSPLPARPARTPTVSVKELGESLMGEHTAALLVAGVLLTAALVGAVVLAADESHGNPEDRS